MHRSITQFLTFIAVLAILLPLTAQAQTTTQSAGALPDGHPQLPSGHPQLPSGHPQMPQGHPQTPAAAGELPSGHPALPSGHPAMPSGHPAVENQPAAVPFTASLAIKVAQGTKDAALPNTGDVKVEFYVNATIAKTIDGKLDEHGVLILENVQLDGPAQALVTLTHAGVPYRALSQPMNAQAPDQMVRVNVFETTNVNPGWQITMRHLMIQQVAQGLLVNEMMVINVPGDRTYVGQALSDKEPLPVTMMIPVSANALQVAAGNGLKNELVKVQGNHIIDALPMSPGTMRVQFAYLVPVKDGKSNVQITAPAQIKQLVVFVPDDGSTVNATDLQPGQSMQMGKDKVRMFTAGNVSSGQIVNLDFTGLPAVSSADAAGHTDDCCEVDKSKVATAQKPTAKSDHSAKVIAGIGAGVLGVGVAVVLAVKKPQPKSTDTSNKG